MEHCWTSPPLQNVLRRLLQPAMAAKMAAHWRQKQLAYTYLRTLMGSYVDFWNVTSDALENTLSLFGILNLTTKEKRYQLDSWLNLQPFPEVQRSLRKLKRVGYKLVVLSNGNPAMLNAGMNNSQLFEYLDGILSVSSVRKFKPAPEVYQLVEKELCVPRKRILFVSSNCWDVIGAANIGLTTAWINRSVNASEPIESLGILPPDYVFTNMEQFAKHFNQPIFK